MKRNRAQVKISQKNEYSLWKVDDFIARPDIAVPFYPSPDRPEISLDGVWNVQMDPGERGFAEKWFARGDVAFENVLKVPGNWHAQGLGGVGSEQKIPQKIKNIILRLGMRTDGGTKFKGSYHGLAWYRKRVDIPRDWANKEIRFIFGGILSNVRLWVNGDFVSGRWTDGNSFYFDVTQQVKPGKSNTFVMVMDNRWKETATISHYHWYAPISGPWHHLVLRALPRVYIKSALVRPEFNGVASAGVAQVHLSVVNSSESEQEASITVQIASLQNSAVSFRETGRVSVAKHETKNVVLPMKIDPVEVWSCDRPNLYKMTARLECREGTDTVRERFGMRTVGTRSNHFELNHQPIFILGQHFHFFWPNELTPPIAREKYLKILNIFKSYGFNHLRVPWLIPEECYQAADEVGILLQVELPLAFKPHNQIKKQLTKRLIKECLESFGNHPSLALLCMSNEANGGSWWDGQGELNPEFCAFSKLLDPTRLVIDTDGRKDENLRESMISDVLSPFSGLGHDWQKYMQGIACERAEYALRPVFDHEFLNVPTLPNIFSFKQYGNGILALPRDLAQLLKQIREQGMEVEYEQYLKASYKHQANFIKEGMERTRKNRLKAGFSMCGWNDIECGIHWGMVDAFLNPKAIHPNEMQVYNSQSVVLMDSIDPHSGEIELVTNYCYDGPFQIQPYVSYFNPEPLMGAVLLWEVSGGGGILLAEGKIKDINLASYEVTRLPRFVVEPGKISAPQPVVLKIRLVGADTKLENSWPLWLFPGINQKTGRKVMVGKNIGGELAKVITDVIINHKTGEQPGRDDSLWVTDKPELALKWLRIKKTVLFLAESDSPPGAGHYGNPFNPGWFKSDGHMGSIIRPDKLLGTFPHEGFASWQFRHLINWRDNFPKEKIAARPIISSVFGDSIPRVQHQLFAANTNTGGHLTYCMLKVLSDRCEVKYFLSQLLMNLKRNETDPIMKIAEIGKYLEMK